MGPKLGAGVFLLGMSVGIWMSLLAPSVPAAVCSFGGGTRLGGCGAAVFWLRCGPFWPRRRALLAVAPAFVARVRPRRCALLAAAPSLCGCSPPSQMWCGPVWPRRRARLAAAPASVVGPLSFVVVVWSLLAAAACSFSGGARLCGCGAPVCSCGVVTFGRGGVLSWRRRPPS